MELLLLLVVATSALTSASASTGIHRQPSPENGEARNAVTAASNAFAFDLYRAAAGARRSSDNLALSPVSAASVLALAWHGSRGRTAQQLQTALHLPRNARLVADGYHALLESIQSARDPVVLRVASQVFARRGVGVRDSFRRTALRSYGADTRELDFANAPEAARADINAWVDASTQGKIKDLFAPGSPTADTLLVLVNAVYFKGGWEKPFLETDTRREPFYVTPYAPVKVPTMHKYGEFLYGEIPELNSKILSLKYIDSEEDMRTKMLIILPESATALANLESRLPSLDFNRLPLERRNVNISLPLFRIEATLKLKDMLAKLGITDLFTRSADLRGMTEMSAYVSDAVQKTFIEVNEKGTEASAATGLEFVFFSSPPPRADFIADRPFVFIVMRGGVVLFIGRVTDPRVSIS